MHIRRTLLMHMHVYAYKPTVHCCCIAQDLAGTLHACIVAIVNVAPKAVDA